MLRLRFIGFLVLLMAPVWGLAASPGLQRSELSLSSGGSIEFPLYASVFLDYQRIGVDDDEFQSPLVAGVVGLWGWPGIGLELELGKSLSDDNIGNLALDVHSQASLNLRLESPPLDGFAVYTLFGITRSHLDTRFTDGIVGKKKIDLRGVRAALGLTLQATRQLVVDAAFTHHKYEDQIGINSIRLGLRYDFTEVPRR